MRIFSERSFTMKYKNIVFDYGKVIGHFNVKDIIFG